MRMQYADAERLDEMVSLYKTLTDAEDRLALMALMVGSLDELMASHADSSTMADTITALLVANRELHHEIMRYWALIDEELMDDGFSIPPLMRKLWAEHDVS